MHNLVMKMRNVNIRKYLTILMISILILSGFGTIISVKGAGVSDQNLTPDETYGWFTEVRIDGVASDTTDEPSMDCFVGEKGVEMQPSFHENITQDPLDAANITHSEVLNDEVKRLVGKDWKSMNSTDWVNGSENFKWITDTIYAETGSFEDNQALPGTFEFDIPNEATPGIYRIPINMQITNYSQTNDQWYGPHQVKEYIWVELAGNAVVGDMSIDPGVEFKQKSIMVTNQAETDLNNVTLKLEETDLEDDAGNQVNLHNPDDTTYVNEIVEGSFHNMKFRVTVPKKMEPQDYELDYTLTATRETDGKTITERGTVTVTINKVAELTADIQGNQIPQGTTKETFTVEFTNTGNLPLQQIKVKANTDGHYFFIPKDYYEDGKPQNESAMKEIGDLKKGESTTVEFVLGMDKQLQIGKHKLDFDYKAYYFDENGGVTGESVYALTGTIDDPYGLLAPSEEPTGFIEVTENPDYTPLQGGKLGINSPYSIQNIEVTDSGYQEIAAEIENNGEVNYGNVMVEMDLEGTPFTSVGTDKQTVMMKGDRFSLDAGTTKKVTFGVNVQSSKIRSMISANDSTFEADLHVTALNQDMVKEVEKTVTAEGQVEGLGPKLKVTPNREERIPVGETFELEYEITNVGDEPVYQLEVAITPTVATEVTHKFSDADEALYFRQASTPPAASDSTVQPAQVNLQPGESTTVTFEMRASKDLKHGDIYYYSVNIMAETRDGQQNWQTLTSVQAEEKEEPEPVVPPAAIWIAVPLVILLVVIAILYRMEMTPLFSKGEEEKETEFEEISEVPPGEGEFGEEVEEGEGEPSESSEEETEPDETPKEPEEQESEEESEEESPWGDEPNF